MTSPACMGVGKCRGSGLLEFAGAVTTATLATPHHPIRVERKLVPHFASEALGTVNPKP